MMNRTTILLSLLLLCSCSNTALEEELATSKEKIVALESELKNLKAEEDKVAPLVHIVLFNLKEDADQAALVAEIKKLEAIEEVQDLEVGPFENLGDDRALSDYELIMQMSFVDNEAYQAYQTHPVHLALKEAAKTYLGGPPATYDFIKE
ncbi:MAG: Dabb family protein [Saprospiraceae bacterium]|nr:Dabb family protein [Saprospiraceae bacterium]